MRDAGPVTDGGRVCEPSRPPRGGDLSVVLRAATLRLSAAGCPSPRADAELLAAHVLRVSRGELVALALRGTDLEVEQAGALAALVARRGERVPLQHLTGTAAFRGLELAVGPGVFVPRPETELTAQLAIDAALACAAGTGAGTGTGTGTGTGRAPVVVDLCTGSGAIALALAREVPGARVHAVELDPGAHAWAQRNLAGSGVELVLGDAASALAQLDGLVDVVVSNPPYVPPGAVPREVEVRHHDPEVALYGGGADGLDVPRAVIARAAALLREGGTLVVEHAEVQDIALLHLLPAPVWIGARGHADLAGAPRCTSATRSR